MAETIFEKNYNLANVFLDDYTLDVGPNNGGDIILGAGFDINELSNPLGTGLSFSGVKEIIDGDTSNVETDIQSLLFSWKQAESIESERKTFALNFSGSWGIAKGSLSYEETKTYFEKSNIYYLELISQSGFKTIQDITSLKWLNTPIAEIIVDDKERFKQFIDDQGSHYVRSIYYGNRIVIRIKSNTKEETFSQSLRAAINAVGATFSVGANISAEHQQTLQNSNLEISISVLGKLVSNTKEEKNRVLLATSYQGVMQLISELRDGVTILKSVPIKCELKSYKFRLNDLPNCKKIYGNIFLSTPAESPFGVPSGTIIAWIPKLSDCRLDADGKVSEIIPPNGWIICNSNSDYNLDGRFLRGTSVFDNVKEIGGDESHKHIVNGNTNGYLRLGKMASGLEGGGDDWQHIHSFSTTSESSGNIPPYFKVIYLIKI